MGNKAVVALTSTFFYYFAIFEYVVLQRKYSESKAFENDKFARVQVFSLALIFILWNQPHYRSKTFQEDMINNLANVAIPGTGIPLSYFCYSYLSCAFLIIFIVPFVSLLAAINKAQKSDSPSSLFIQEVCDHYIEHLLHPTDWFSLWQLNCRLTSYHSYLTQFPGFEEENKWTFLVHGKECNVPVTPFLDNESIVCKNVNIEGGLGIHIFKNAIHGGEWIIQERLKNAKWLQELLPDSAPLSTMRVITTSSWSMSHDTAPNRNTADSEMESDSSIYIEALSATLRLGLANASTDHKSVLFPVNLETGIIQDGVSNLHWYQLGLANILRCPWLPSTIPITSHPDPPYPVITGVRIPAIEDALKIVINAHYKMMKDVPIVGWDVAFTTKGIYLLEVNLSCNFFRGQFDMNWYIQFVDRYWDILNERDHRLLADSPPVGTSEDKMKTS